MKREERLIYYLLMAALIFFLLHTCASKDRLKVVETKSTDIVYKSGKRDTIYIPQKARLVYIKVPVPFNEETDPKDSTIVIREYSSPYEDSLIKGNMNVKVRGELLAQSLLYTPKFPKYIKQTDTIEITNTITKTLENEPKGALVLGGMFSGNATGIGITPMAGIMDKGQRSYLLGYDVVNKTFSLTFVKPIRLRK